MLTGNSFEDRDKMLRFKREMLTEVSVEMRLGKENFFIESKEKKNLITNHSNNFLVFGKIDKRFGKKIIKFRFSINKVFYSKNFLYEKKKKIADQSAMNVEKKEKRFFMFLFCFVCSIKMFPLKQELKLKSVRKISMGVFSFHKFFFIFFLLFFSNDLLTKMCIVKIFIFFVFDNFLFLLNFGDF